MSSVNIKLVKVFNSLSNGVSDLSKSNVQLFIDSLTEHNFDLNLLQVVIDRLGLAKNPNPENVKFVLIVAEKLLSRKKLSFQFNSLSKLLNVGLLSNNLKEVVKLCKIFIDNDRIFSIPSNVLNKILRVSVETSLRELDKDVYSLISTYLTELLKENKVECVNILRKIMVSFLKSSKQSDEESNAFSVATLVLEIFENSLESYSRTGSCHLAKLIIKGFPLEDHIYKLIVINTEQDVRNLIVQIAFILPFFHLISNKDQNNHVPLEVVMVQLEKMLKPLFLLIDYDQKFLLMYLFRRSLLYWKLAGIKVVERWKQGPFLFDFQLAIFLGLSTSKVERKLFGVTLGKIEMHPSKSKIVSEINDRVALVAYRFYYKFWEYVTDMDEFIPLAMDGLDHLMNARMELSKELLRLFFKIFCYHFEDIINNVKNNLDFFNSLEGWIYVERFLECLEGYIEILDPTLQDGFECTYCINLCIEFFETLAWQSKVVVKGLKLLEVSIAKSMSPNLALLIDKTSDSTLAFIGPLLFAKLYDTCWEVRNAALQVLCTISHNASKKFPSFQNIILDSDLSSLIVKLAFKDNESEVRVTALKCLQEMIRIELFWNDLLEIQNLHEDLLDVLLNEPEGKVRAQAVSLLTSILDNHGFKNDATRIFEILNQTSFFDVDSDVKKNCLLFWEKVLNSQLENQGMIDGEFPEFTFSKECRKIVQLTEIEIRKRLEKVLIQLNDLGCLSILMNKVENDVDLEVSKSAVKVIKKLGDLLGKYNVSGATFCCSPSPRSDSSSPSSFSFPSSSSSVCERTGGGCNLPASPQILSINCTKVDIDEFILYTKKDFEAFLIKRKETDELNKFEELLDQILAKQTVVNQGINVMECSF